MDSSSGTKPPGRPFIWTKTADQIIDRPVRHGVSTVRSTRRRTLGLVFHDA